MANFTLKPGPFPVGTTVGVYDHKTLIQDGGPIGAQLASAVTAADQTTAFTGLAFDTRYWAAASVSGTWRKVAFTTERDPLVSGSVSSVAGKTGAVSLVKGDVGLGSVDNTADSGKPISTATQAAIDADRTRLGLLEGGSPIARATKTAAYSMTTADGTILANAATAAFTVTLPPATSIGQRVVVRKIDSSVNVVTVQRAGTDTIEGLTSITLPLQYDYIDVVLEETGKWYGR